MTALLRVPLATYLNKYYFLKNSLQPGFQKIFSESAVNIFIWVLLFVTVKLLIDRILFKRYIDSIEKEKTKNELEFLRAQFNPHFLFNSINSIYGNIDKHNSAAREMLLTFSEMLRYQLYECNSNVIPIEKEINYLKNYVILQQTRKPENMKIDLNICEDVKGVSIAPLLFTAFIENAFKYVSHFDDKLNEVKISLSREKDHLIFTIFNTKEKLNGHRINDHNGIGIANVKRRLELLYPYKHDLKLNSSDSSYEVVLNLQV
jgi:LytS/YehU family sensor histidine kinase